VGYLYDNLPPEGIVECVDLYPYILVVTIPSGDPFGGIDEDTIGQIIQEVVPDVEEFQFAGVIPTEATFRFHHLSDRTAAADLLRSMGYTSRTTEYAPAPPSGPGPWPELSTIYTHGWLPEGSQTTIYTHGWFG
jgi:hypothetical protein